MKKIGILTFHASHNYGSMLQAYALQTYLMQIGHEVQIINLRPLLQKKMYANPSVFVDFSIKKLAKAILYPKLYFNNVKKWNIFEDFLKTYLRITDKEYSTYEEIQKDLYDFGFDVLISGGDQIWNQKCKDFELSYFLPFDLDGVKKISYAPSMGKRALEMKESPYVDNIINYISHYDVLSVREPDSAEVLSSLLNRTVDVVADPVFLLGISEYDSLIQEKPIIDGKYLFYYTPSHLAAPKAFNAAKELAKKKGLKFVSSNVLRNQTGIIQVNAAGPIQFLNLLKHAEFVCGQSFHLAVFSLLYHKEFAVLGGDIDPRMVNLLNNCHIPNRGINVDSPVFSKMEELNYKKIDGYFDVLREKSVSFLRNSLA